MKKNWINEKNKIKYTKIHGLKIKYNYYYFTIENAYKIKDYNKILIILNKFLKKTDFVFKGNVKQLAHQWISYNILLPEGMLLHYTFKNSIPFTQTKIFACVSFFSIQKRRFLKWIKKKKLKKSLLALFMM